jgi:hypothetical protein
MQTRRTSKRARLAGPNTLVVGGIAGGGADWAEQVLAGCRPSCPGDLACVQSKVARTCTAVKSRNVTSLRACHVALGGHHGPRRSLLAPQAANGSANEKPGKPGRREPADAKRGKLAQVRKPAKPSVTLRIRRLGVRVPPSAQPSLQVSALSLPHRTDRQRRLAAFWPYQ